MLLLCVSLPSPCGIRTHTGPGALHKEEELFPITLGKKYRPLAVCVNGNRLSSSVGVTYLVRADAIDGLGPQFAFVKDSCFAIEQNTVDRDWAVLNRRDHSITFGHDLASDLELLEEKLGAGDALYVAEFNKETEP